MSSGAKSVGHPVDVATGVMWKECEDFVIPGRFPLLWSRRYATSLLGDRPSPLGNGWTSPYFAALTHSGTDYVFRTPQGDNLTFEDFNNSVQRGAVVRRLGNFMEIDRDGFLLRVTKWDVDSENLVRYVFDPGLDEEFWPLRSVQDASGMGLDLIWDSEGRLRELQQKLEKRKLTLTYTADSKLAGVGVILSSGERKIVARYEYDANQRLVAAYDAMDVAERYEYDDAGRMLREVAKDGAVFSFKYDEKGRCIRTNGLERYDWKSLRYIEEIGWTDVTDSYGNLTRYQWLPSGQVVSEVDPLGGKSLTEYDAEGRPVRETDPLGNATVFEYDSEGNRSKITDPAGGFVTLKYQEGHLIQEVSDALNETWRRYYDGADRLVRLEGPSGEKWSARFDRDGLLLEVFAPNGASRRFTYTPDGVPLSETDWAGHVTHFQVDDIGRIIARQDPLGHTEKMTYDWLGNLLSLQRTTGSVFTFSYDAVGNTTSMVDENGNRTSYVYGTCRRLLEEIAPDDSRRKYLWGSEPKMLTAVINEKGETFSLFHDAAGRVKAQIGFDRLKTEYEYDLAGNCVAILLPSGARTEFEWGPSGLLLKRIGIDKTATTFQYDAMGNMTAALNSVSQVVLDRDRSGRIVREVQVSGQVVTDYDVLDNPVTTETNLGYRLSRKFDANGRLSGFQTPESGRVQMERNGLGLEINRLFPGDLTLRQDWDQGGNLREQTLSKTRSTVSGVRRSYWYDKAGNLARLSDSRWGVYRYVHDVRDRLLQVLRENATSEQFTFDDANNLTSITRGTEPPEGLEYGPGNRLLRFGSIRYEYNLDGQLTRRVEAVQSGAQKIWVYTWDGDRNLASVTTPEGVEWRYFYDALGRRILKEGPGISRRYLWNRQVVIQEIEQGKVKSGWVHDPESFQLLSKLKDGNAYWAINDQLGTAREMINPQGGLAWARDYAAWGGKGAGEDIVETDCAVRFQGQWEDEESGLHYNGFRYYDPAIGRYISPDPLGLDAGLNAYTYAPSPVNWIDPFGLACTKKQQEKLKKDAKAIHAKFKKGDEQNRRTVAVAILTDPKTGKQTKVYAVSSDRTSRAAKREAEKLGYSQVTMQEGAPSTHAEQIIMDHARANGLQSTIAPNRDACGPERQDCRGRADRSRNHTILDPD